MSIVKWQLDVGFSGGGIYGAGAALGIAFTNVASGLYLNYDDHNTDNQLVLADSPGGLATWNFAPFGGFVSGARRWFAIRRDGDNDGNLNVRGGCGGAEVMLYPWQDGETNELWQIDRA